MNDHENKTLEGFVTVDARAAAARVARVASVALARASARGRPEECALSVAEVSRRLSDRGLHESLKRIVSLRGVFARDVEDVVQEALTQAFASKRLPSDPAAFVRYVRAMARNIARKTAAQKKKAAALFDEDAFANEEDDEEERAGARHEVARVMAEEASTADPQAFGWMVRHVGGETYEEIARATTLKTEGVRARIRRLREALVVSRARARAGGEGAKGTDEARRIDDDR